MLFVCRVCGIQNKQEAKEEENVFLLHIGVIIRGIMARIAWCVSLTNDVHNSYEKYNLYLRMQQHVIFRPKSICTVRLRIEPLYTVVQSVQG